ncbi:thiol reductant ABC exporter subunit CydC [Aureimonas endophytica]|uniref:Thiol reductant ABC exporter subunit CydC n=1 Tax=Aureimonas endophytica TaxID=2027858 RepID=A0A916ZMU9_9HYPH|nr:thiol reductant ABC exporter subunit CydC [Aureimonas endophytica]GGE03430.1 thiol reductant ABC exporter subunit CydC [Aureimonas endophytica]
MSALLAFRPLFAPHARGFLLALVLSIVGVGAGILLLGVSGWFLTAASLTTLGAAFNLFGPSAAVRGLSFLRIGARYGEKLAGHDATLRTLGTIRAWTFRRMLPRVSPADRAVRRGDLVSRLTADVDALDTVFLLAIGPLLASLAVGVGLFVALHHLLPQAAPIYAAGSLAAGLLVPLGLAIVGRSGGAAIRAASADLRAAALDGVDGHADLIAFGRADEAASDVSARAGRLGALRRRQCRRAAIGSAAVQFLAGATGLGVLLAGLAALESGTIGGPLLAGLVLAVLGSFEGSALILRGTSRLGEAQEAARRLRDLADRLPAIVEPAAPSCLPEGGSLACEWVTFGFDPARPVLRDVCLTVGTGEHVAIRGPSGSGKSALLHLFLRLSDPQGGRVLVSGIDVRRCGLSALRSRVAFLEQDAPVFLDTVRGNLLLGCPKARDEELWSTLEQVRLAPLVRSMPLGLDTPLGEAGRTLSAGEARRLCLARVLLSPAEILVLDEPTSGLDRQTEAAFLDDIAATCAGRTVVLATHADLPAGAFDRTFKLVNGGLVQEP